MDDAVKAPDTQAPSNSDCPPATKRSHGMGSRIVWRATGVTSALKAVRVRAGVHDLISRPMGVYRGVIHSDDKESP